MAVAFEHGRGEVRGEQRAQLARLGTAIATVVSARGSATLSESIVRGASTLGASEHVYLCLPSRADTQLRLRDATGVFASMVGHEFSSRRSFAGRAEGWERSELISDYPAWPSRRHELVTLGVRSLVEVRFATGVAVGGTLGVARLESGSPFSELEAELLTQLAQCAALALDSAHLGGLAEREFYARQRIEEELRDMVAWLQRSEDEVRHSHAETITRLAHAAEFRNLETAVHVERMSRYCAALASRIGFSEERVELIRVASTLHDLGKIAIPDAILLKPGTLAPEERRIMMRHPELGKELLSGSSSEVLELAAEIALSHHERFDGSGYPRGLAGEQIPIEGRIAAIADVFDALLSDRVYRPAFSLETARSMMRAERGMHFDPELLDLFLHALPELDAAPAPTDARAPASDPPPENRDQRAAAPTVSAIRSLREIAKRARPTTTLDTAQLRRACADAIRILEQVGHGKEAIDLAVARLTRGWDGMVIASVYLLEHERLWVISQRGYSDLLHDGFPLDQGVMARAVRSGETQFLADVSTDTDFIAAAPDLVSEVAVPFPSELPVGVFNVETVGVRLPPEAATLFNPLVEVLAARLESMRDGLGLDISSLARVCVHASSLRGTTAIAEFATRTFGRFLGLESAQLALRSPDGALRVASHWRRPDSRLDALDLSSFEALDRSRSRDDPVTSFGVTPAAALGGSASAEGGSPWVVWLPLRVAGDEIGTLVGRSNTREIDREHIEAASLIAQHAAALIDGAQRLRREQRAATTDALTGLLNRRGFEERFADELSRAERHREDVALLMIDCDGLKRINDLDGHHVGDGALQRLARCIRNHKRASDSAARFGGDEFAIVLNGAGLAEAGRIAERIRDELGGRGADDGQRLTASFGLAVFPAHGTTPAELLAAADGALYRAKRAGGNRVLEAAA